MLAAQLVAQPWTDQPRIDRRARRSRPMPTLRAGRGDRHGSGTSGDGDDTCSDRMAGGLARKLLGWTWERWIVAAPPCQRLKPNGGNAPKAWFRRSRKRGTKGNAIVIAAIRLL